jgi:hypothetical protein
MVSGAGVATVTAELVPHAIDIDPIELEVVLRHTCAVNRQVCVLRPTDVPSVRNPAVPGESPKFA